MNEQIKQAIDEFICEFKNQDIVKKYLSLKKILSEDKEFLLLKEERKNAQKSLALSINTEEYEHKKNEFLKIDEMYRNYPLYMNYLSYEKQIEILLSEIEIYAK